MEISIAEKKQYYFDTSRVPHSVSAFSTVFK